MLYVQRNKVLILNEGNYKSQDGSVYVYDEDTKMMTSFHFFSFLGVGPNLPDQSSTHISVVQANQEGMFLL